MKTWRIETRVTGTRAYTVNAENEDAAWDEVLKGLQPDANEDTDEEVQSIRELK